MEEIQAIPLETGSFQGRIHLEYDCPEIRKALSDCGSLLADARTKILLDSRNLVGALTIRSCSTHDFDVVIKEYRDNLLGRWKTRFQPSRARRAWRNASVLVRGGIPTPRPIAYLEQKEGRLVGRNYFIMEWLKCTEEIRYPLMELSGRPLQALIEALARFVAEIHTAGILHHDLSDGNILIRPKQEGGYHFFLVDIKRVRFRREIGRFRAVGNLVRLGIPRRNQHDFLASYLNRKPGTLWWWYRFNKIRFSTRITLKKKLGLKKLAKKLKLH